MSGNCWTKGGSKRFRPVSTGRHVKPGSGAAPAKPEKLVETFLGDGYFLMVSPNAFNGLGVGTTQLYNAPVVYNRKRHGKFTLEGRVYDFRMRPSVPKRLSKEVLLVDLLHNLERLPEDKSAMLPRALERAKEMNRSRLAKAVQDFGSARAERSLASVLEQA